MEERRGWAGLPQPTAHWQDARVPAGAVGGAAGSRVAPADHTVSHTTWDQAPRCCFLPVIWWLLAATYCVPLGTLCTAVTTLTDQVLTEGPGR